MLSDKNELVAAAEATARAHVIEAYRVDADGTPSHLDGVMILDESGECHVMFSSPLAAIKVAQRVIEIASRVSDVKAAIYDEVQALNKNLYGNELPAPLMRLADYRGAHGD